MFYVYAIRSLIKNYIYVGLTKDVEERILRHNSGYEKTTKPFRPFELILVEEVLNRAQARTREKYWKSGIGKERLRRVNH